MLPHYLVKCTHFSSFSFSPIRHTVELRIAEASCCDMGLI